MSLHYRKFCVDMIRDFKCENPCPKIANFCRKGLPLSKTYWMIVSPQKRVKKMPTICTCQTFIYYVNWLKTNFEVIFKAHFRAKKISKIIMGP